MQGRTVVSSLIKTRGDLFFFFLLFLSRRITRSFISYYFVTIIGSIAHHTSHHGGLLRDIIMIISPGDKKSIRNWNLSAIQAVFRALAFFYLQKIFANETRKEERERRK